MLTLAHIPRPASFRHRRISTPQGMDVMAGVMLLLVMFYMLTTKPKPEGGEPGPYLNLPSVFGTSDCMPESHQIIISLDAQNRLSIATSEGGTQIMTIARQVAQAHRIQFTATHLRQIQQLQYLNQNIEQLPAWLSASATERQRMTTDISARLTYVQLLECLLTAQTASRAEFGKPAVLFLRIDKDVSAARVKQLLGLLQNQGINRFNLMAERKEGSRNRVN